MPLHARTKRNFDAHTSLCTFHTWFRIVHDITAMRKIRNTEYSRYRREKKKKEEEVWVPILFRVVFATIRLDVMMEGAMTVRVSMSTKNETLVVRESHRDLRDEKSGRNLNRVDGLISHSLFPSLERGDAEIDMFLHLTSIRDHEDSARDAFARSGKGNTFTPFQFESVFIDASNVEHKNDNSKVGATFSIVCHIIP